MMEKHVGMFIALSLGYLHAESFEFFNNTHEPVEFAIGSELNPPTGQLSTVIQPGSEYQARVTNRKKPQVFIRKRDRNEPGCLFQLKPRRGKRVLIDIEDDADYGVKLVPQFTVNNISEHEVEFLGIKKPNAENHIEMLQNELQMVRDVQQRSEQILQDELQELHGAQQRFEQALKKIERRLVEVQQKHNKVATSLEDMIRREKETQQEEEIQKQNANDTEIPEQGAE